MSKKSKIIIFVCTAAIVLFSYYSVKFFSALRRTPPLDIYSSFASGYLDEGHYAESIKYTNKALELDPDNPDLLNMLAVCYLYQGKFAEALPYLEKCVKLAPKYYQTFNNLGLVFQHARQFDEAKASFAAFQGT